MNVLSRVSAPDTVHAFGRVRLTETDWMQSVQARDRTAADAGTGRWPAAPARLNAAGTVRRCCRRRHPQCYQRSTRDPRIAPATPVSTIPSEYQTATNAADASGHESE